MERNIILAQVKALRSYLKSYLEEIIPHKNEEDFTPEHDEIYKISQRYRRLRNSLKSLFPDVFSDLMDFSSNSGVQEVEELSRELSYILETVESMSLESTPSSEQTFNSTEGTSDENNAPFTVEERKQIEERLNEIQDYLVKTISEQDTSEDELKTKVEFIREEINDVKEATSKMGRRDWRGTFINTMIAVTIAVGFAPDARQGLFLLIQNLITLIKQTRLLNP